MLLFEGGEYFDIVHFFAGATIIRQFYGNRPVYSLLQIVAVTGFLIFLLVFYLSLIIARKIAVPPRRSYSLPDESGGLTYEPAAFESFGSIVRGCFIPRSDGSFQHKSNVIILVHGWGAHALTMLPYAKIFHNAGYHVLIFSARNHGNSDNTGFSSVYQFHKDLLKAIDFLESRYAAIIGKIAVLGHSMGASCLILTMAQDKRISAGIACSAFADPFEVVKKAMKWRRIPPYPFIWIIMKYYERQLGISRDKVTPVKQIDKISAPLLLIHGSADTTIPVSNTYRLMQRAPGSQVKMTVLDTIGHENLLEYRKLPEILTAFLEEALGQE